MTAPVTDTLFDHPARPTDPQTSHDAARRDRATLVGDVREILRRHPEGLTDDRIWQLSGLPFNRHGSVVKARKHAGAVATGRFGESLSGSRATIWTLPENAGDQ